MKYPAVYPYKKTSDKGQELKYSIRSLKNVKNWNGEVFVAGDREKWFGDEIKMIDSVRSHIKHKDVGNKRMAIVADPRVADDFLYLNDDMYILTPTEIKPLHQGEIGPYTVKSTWLDMKLRTRDYLKEKGIDKPLDYELHVPMILNKQRIVELRETVGIPPQTPHMSYRTLYGNLFNIGGEYYKDRKTKTNKLLEGNLLSTRVFTPELKELFNEPSKYEREI